MANKKSSLNLWYCGAALFALVAVIMMFVTNVKIVGAVTKEPHFVASGLQATFGYAESGVSIFSFSFMNLITYALLLAGLVLVCLKACGVAKSNLVDLVALGLFVVGGVFFFLMPSFSVSEYAKGLGSLVSLQLGVGAILSAVFSFVSACLLCTKALLKK